MSTSTRSRSRSRGGICFEHDLADGTRKRVTINQRADPIDDARLEVSEPDARTFADRLPAIPLPGSGSTRDEPACGEEVPALFCPDCGEPEWVGSTCRRSRCPRCWQAWDFHRVRSLAAKLESLRDDRQERENGKSQKFHHVTVSLRESIRFDADDALGRGFDAVKALMNDVNVDTGYIAYHPWRIAEEYRGEVNGHASGNGNMTWKDVLEKVEHEDWSWAAVRDEFLLYSPHFHVIALSEFVQGGDVSEQIEEETGVVIERITGGDSSVSIYGIEELAKVSAYCLSHVGLEPRGDGWRAAYRPFGEVANHKASPAAEMKADDALREVAWEVLGVDFAKPACGAPQTPAGDDHGHEHGDAADRQATPAATTSTSTSSSSSSSTSTSTTAASAATALPSKAPAGELPDRDTDWATGSNTGLSTNSAESLPDAVPSWVDDPHDGVGEDDLTAAEQRCGSTLRPMFAVDRWLEDEEWCDRVAADRLARLEDAREEWTALGKPAPEDVPPPDDDPPD